MNKQHIPTRALRRFLCVMSVAIIFCTEARAGEMRRVVNEFAISGGLTQEQFSDIVQDSLGYIYIGTWDGIVRFDGYRFDTFRPNNEEIITWRMAKVRLGEDDNLYCEIFNRRLYRFDTKTCRFSEPLDSISKWDSKSGYRRLEAFLPDDEMLKLYPNAEQCFRDRQGNVWLRGLRTLAMMSTYEENFERLVPGNSHFIRSTYQSSDGTIWQGGNPGYLLCGDKYVTPTGALTSIPTQFADFGIYSLIEDANGRMLVGTRGDGLFRLTPVGGRFRVENWRRPSVDNLSLVDIKPGDRKSDMQSNETLSLETPSLGITDDNIYEIIPDGRGGYLIATWGGGITRFTNGQFTITDKTRLRRIHRLSDKVLAASTNGLLVYAGERRYHHLKGCDITAIMVHGSHIYVTVYGQGLFTIPIEDACAEHARVEAFPVRGVDIPQPITTATVEGDNLWMFSSNAIVRLSLTDSTAASVYNPSSMFYETHFNRLLNISETQPTVLTDRRILLGTQQGSVILDTGSPATVTAPQHIAITGVQHQGDVNVTPLYNADTLTISPDNRSFLLFVSTLDFKNAHNVRFQYRLDGIDREWTYSSSAKFIGFNAMRPGTYHLRIRAVSIEDQALSVERVVVVDVVPLFYETLLFKILLTLLCIIVVGAMFYTSLYIHRMRRRHCALEEYCHTLLGAEVKNSKTVEESRPWLNSGMPAGGSAGGTTGETEQSDAIATDVPTNVDDDPSAMSVQDKQLLDKFMATFNLYMSDSNKALDDYASAMNMSYSSLYRKMKQLLGCTPIEFINRLRIQVATDLFNRGEQQISDVAYRVGFADPKYFSKCFKARTGMTPTQYIESRTRK